MKLAILGTRGVPNNHGGFEQFAEYFSVQMAEYGHEVYVYNSHDHPYQESTFNGVNIIHCYDPEFKIGTVGQFIYDLNCILDSRKRNFDVILQLGYTSSSIWHWLMPKKSVIVTNMDGLEWKRSKYRPIVRKFLKYAEKLGAKYSDFLIADSIGIQSYLLEEYNKHSEFIAYGATNIEHSSPTVLSEYQVKEFEYSMIIARLEPENNIETIIKGYIESDTRYPLIIIGGLNNYGLQLQEKYKGDSRIIFKGPNYNQSALNDLRNYSRYYFHGHSVGGTNPSLLEAMASNSLIIANDNIFNKSILGNEAFYFSSSNDISEFLNEDLLFGKKKEYTILNREKINHQYNWNIICKKYENLLLQCIS